MMPPLPRVTEAIDQTKRCCVVNVATDHYCVGQARLCTTLDHTKVSFLAWADTLPPGSPPHSQVPYAFKAYALHEAARTHSLVCWMDACIVPVKPLDRIWEYASQHGAWFSRNGWTNYQWTADSAYPDLFPDVPYLDDGCPYMDIVRGINRKIEHVVATAFALDLSHPKGRAFLDEYYRLAGETKAFCGPWINSDNYIDPIGRIGDGAVQKAVEWAEKDKPNPRLAACGPVDVMGHRHDQTAASVIAWRLGIPLTSPPDLFAYKGGETEATVLIADGAY